MNKVVRDLAGGVWSSTDEPSTRGRPAKKFGHVHSGAPTFRGDVPGDYPGDYTRCPALIYAPHPDTLADPGEVVWTWVPFEEDYSKGKDRPVLVIGRDGEWLLALPLTSKDHDRDMAEENAAGRWWVDIGSGEWDREHRPSEVRVDRIIRVDPGRVRRTAGRLPRDRFDRVAHAVAQHWAD